MEKCHICMEPIWENRWPAASNSAMKKSVCFYCFTKLREGGEYKPQTFTKSNLAVCDKCGEISANVKLTNAGWFCEECSE